MSFDEKVFKAYDVRGIYPDQVDEAFAAQIGKAYAAVLGVKKVAVGIDVRTSSPSLKDALISSLVDAGLDVIDIGTITTDQLYFAVGHYGYDGGISVTASHNPAEYNGFKFTEKEGRPVQPENLSAMRDWIKSGQSIPKVKKGARQEINILDDYVNEVLSLVDSSEIKPLKVVVNANFGAVGSAIDKISSRLKLKLETLNWEQDGNFPKGPPNPLLPSNRTETQELIKKVKPDLGVAWDADADRVFFFGGSSQFIPSCYIIALLSKEFLAREPGAKIVHDATTSWVIDEEIKKSGGHSLINRTGHTFMKARMRQEQAVFAGESSGHYYFRDTYFADNGLLPFLMIAKLVSKSGQTLDELVKPLMDLYKISGEINFEIEDTSKAIERIEKEYGPLGKVSHLDGVIIESPEWRFSVRASNTEPLLRLNAEARDQKVLDNLVTKLSKTIRT